MSTFIFCIVFAKKVRKWAETCKKRYEIDLILKIIEKIAISYILNGNVRMNEKLINDVDISVFMYLSQCQIYFHYPNDNIIFYK